MTDIQKQLFQKNIKRVNTILKITGLFLNEYEEKLNLKIYFKQRWFFCLNFLCIFYDVISQITWLVQKFYTGISLVELTYSGPCLAICILGCFKSYYFIKNMPHIYKFIKTLSVLYYVERNQMTDMNKRIEDYMQYRVKFLSIGLYTLSFFDGLGIITFGVGPILISFSNYYATGNLHLLLPFFLAYPFDSSDIRYWPIAYVHQIWSAIVAVFTVLGPDNFFYTSCVLLDVQFFQLKHEIESIFDYDDLTLNNFRFKLKDIVDRHRELLRCVNLLDSAFSKSSLCNILTSSLLICFTGFNVMAYDNLLVVIPFISFLFMVIGQIYLLCYYGDLILKSSAEISNAVYNCGWYKVKSTVVKNLMIISYRAQKPCKLTSFGFADINIVVFTKIMSRSWSYFALLWSFHRNDLQ
ncbi:unnamed protein product [Parnassius mnemosyne]|uniref:Odorant receptor n=1 Tax=Parnassius mnemosyne TaxID=213953 RepID=A0AAV1K810_9NEOP